MATWYPWLFAARGEMQKGNRWKLAQDRPYPRNSQPFFSFSLTSFLLSYIQNALPSFCFDNSSYSLEFMATLNSHHYEKNVFSQNWQLLPHIQGLIYVHNCLEFTSLLEEMHSLKNLHTLDISSCPHLEERCQNETSEEWPKISHIPHLCLEDEVRTDTEWHVRSKILYLCFVLVCLLYLNLLCLTKCSNQ